MLNPDDVRIEFAHIPEVRQPSLAGLEPGLVSGHVSRVLHVLRVRQTQVQHYGTLRVSRELSSDTELIPDRSMTYPEVARVEAGVVCAHMIVPPCLGEWEPMDPPPERSSPDYVP